MITKEFAQEINAERRLYLIEKITKELSTLNIEELVDINCIIEKRQFFVGFDNMGNKIYNYPQPGLNLQLNHHNYSSPINMRQK